MNIKFILSICKDQSKNYRKTQLACYLGFVTQAIVANFTPLLFIAFHREYGIPIASLAGCMVSGLAVGIMWPVSGGPVPSGHPA